MGWLGWSESDALAADVNAILVAMQGRVAMLKAVFGGEDKPHEAKPVSQRPMGPELFKALWG
jgi:hypothetical protein